MTTPEHDALCAIPDRVTRLEESVARIDLWVTELLKQVANLRQQQIDTAIKPLTVPRQAYTFTEAAALLGCTRTQIYDLVKTGRLHPVTVGTRARRIPAGEIRRLLTEKAPI